MASAIRRVVCGVRPSVTCSMIHRRAGAPDERLDAMVRAIVEGVAPTRVILFGSRARGDARSDSDYDLVVELTFDRSTRAGYSEASVRVHTAMRPVLDGIAVDVLIRAPGEIEAKRDDPGYMDWEIARDGVVLYPPGASSDALRPLVRPMNRLRERPPYESVQSWLQKISEDLWVIERALEAGESAAWGAAGFHAQQAAEKLLKILFVQAGVHPPRTHLLDELLAQLRPLGYALPPFEAECALLKDYAVDVRYSERMPIPNEAGGREVIAAARRVMAAVEPLIRR